MQSLRILSILFLLSVFNTTTSADIVELDSDYCDWYFSIGKTKNQYLAIVPGSNINDLVCNKIIPNPYMDNHIAQLKWIEDSSFTYVTTFNLKVRNEFKYEMLFEGLDTYAEVYLNNELVLKGNNMFLAYQKDITILLRDGTNILKIVFKSAVEVGKQKAKQNSIIFPADNEEAEVKVSPYIRKAAFQFGWDINPRLISCGIWRPIKIISNAKNIDQTEKLNTPILQVKTFYNIKFENDAKGQSFAFYSNEKKPIHTFMYGANYVPYNMYPLPLKTYKRTAHLQQYQGLPNRHDYYRNLFEEVKNYGCNMLRVWGGGWYEDEYFYNLADSMHIAIWQDFMFANTMYPGDKEWMSTVKEEINQNIKRLSKHPCIVLWSGNNEIEVAWENWGWQAKYNYTVADSLKLINDYKLLFEEIIPSELKKQKSTVAYIPSSPMSNWGKSEDFHKGDNHYWGIWHGEAPLEDFNTHVPRFASEYGMPSLGVNSSLSIYNSNNENRSFQNEMIWNRMKSYKGMKLLNRYISDYLPSPMSDSALSYASRYVQYKALKMAYNAHLYHFPFCSGSLFWQFNESWPGITWAAIDYAGNRKIPPYASHFSVILNEKALVKIKYNTLNKKIIKECLIEFNLKDSDGKILKKYSLKGNYNDLKAGLEINPYLIFDSLDLKNNYLIIALKNNDHQIETIIWDTLLLLAKEKEYILQKPIISLTKIDEHNIKISSNTLVLGLFLESNGNSKLRFNQNFIDLEAGEEKIISLKHDDAKIDLPSIGYYSIYNLQAKLK